ncbi:hypothetical protein [Burkholderia ubonensis]|uniref:hypothetical protein n=1 Tax=Burkholderia ubonensis TaxID=101571 RepID=UPI001E4BD34C|nr:hypothetical protein [Burkholderia ubonensis]
MMSRGGLPHILKSAQPGLPEALAVHAARAVLAEVNLELVRLIGSHGVKALGVTGQDRLLHPERLGSVIAQRTGAVTLVMMVDHPRSVAAPHVRDALDALAHGVQHVHLAYVPGLCRAARIAGRRAAHGRRFGRRAVPSRQRGPAAGNPALLRRFHVHAAPGFQRRAHDDRALLTTRCRRYTVDISLTISRSREFAAPRG